MGGAKPFDIPKKEIWEAFKRVRANGGAAGVDGESIAEFEADLTGNLYKLWNRLSSGSYFPPPVRRVDIPKPDGGARCGRDGTSAVLAFRLGPRSRHQGLLRQYPARPSPEGSAASYWLPLDTLVH